MQFSEEPFEDIYITYENLYDDLWNDQLHEFPGPTRIISWSIFFDEKNLLYQRDLTIKTRKKKWIYPKNGWSTLKIKYFLFNPYLIKLYQKLPFTHAGYK